MPGAPRPVPGSLTGSRPWGGEDRWRASRTGDATSTATRTATRRVVGGSLTVRCRPRRHTGCGAARLEAPRTSQRAAGWRARCAVARPVPARLRPARATSAIRRGPRLPAAPAAGTGGGAGTRRDPDDRPRAPNRSSAYSPTGLSRLNPPPAEAATRLALPPLNIPERRTTEARPRPCCSSPAPCGAGGRHSCRAGRGGGCVPREQP
jgi:hypothetical protein